MIIWRKKMFWNKKIESPQITRAEFDELRLKIKYVETEQEIQDTAIRRLRSMLGKHISQHEDTGESDEGDEDVPPVSDGTPIKKAKSIRATDPVFM